MKIEIFKVLCYEYNNLNNNFVLQKLYVNIYTKKYNKYKVYGDTGFIKHYEIQFYGKGRIRWLHGDLNIPKKNIKSIHKYRFLGSEEND